ncbi:MAG: cell wall-binding repeat-containing protein [Pseudoclavibacter sp.]|nr:cell wall-binding repeat-containing protein [Pseudoclavibacter sp.]
MSRTPRARMRRAVLPLLAALLAAPLQPAAAAALAAPSAAERIEGADRFATAAAVAARLAPGPGGAVVLATGTDYADALAAGPVAARLGAPVLLAAGASLPEPTRSAIERQRPERIVVVGSERAVSAEAEAELRALVPAAAIERHGGRDRHETAALLARAFFPGPAAQAFVATGSDYPDALVAAPLAAAQGAPLLLSRRDCAPEPVDASVARLLAGVGDGGLRITAIGRAVEPEAVLRSCAA